MVYKDYDLVFYSFQVCPLFPEYLNYGEKFFIIDLVIDFRHS
jgi:hypothetical protein